ncbi:hypothetical protein ZEAMMB73_Zm00001d030899 [Zea mays]|uniref:Uncharacterized protein n=1 Tax=Zea mays TaxID=4577 RepID=A0A1D6KEX7_MAIZE|nr:hypothetical protein ZEAMMB73_Zm00001d030899 [Zea mays]
MAIFHNETNSLHRLSPLLLLCLTWLGVVATKEIGLDQDLSMEILTQVVNAGYQLRICSTCQQKTVSSSAYHSRYSTDYRMFRFCVANTELDWRPGTEQYRFIEHCLSSVDRHKQPWLIFLW